MKSRISESRTDRLKIWKEKEKCQSRRDGDISSSNIPRSKVSKHHVLQFPTPPEDTMYHASHSRYVLTYEKVGMYLENGGWWMRQSSCCAIPLLENSLWEIRKKWDPRDTEKRKTTRHNEIIQAVPCAVVSVGKKNSYIGVVPSFVRRRCFTLFQLHIVGITPSE